MHFIKVIEALRKETDEVLLFHSGTGKDSIMLMDLLSKSFNKVQCVFMYIVKGLEYENNYITWAENKYPNCSFYQTPHYALYSFIKHGYLGITQNKDITKKKISQIDAECRKKFNINFSIYGFKKSDGITRRLMLNDCTNGINSKSNKCYPLMDLTNKDVLNYIADNNLITPFNYGTKKPSSGCDISTPEFLVHLKKYHPSDLSKIFKQFPEAEVKLFHYENYGKN